MSIGFESPACGGRNERSFASVSRLELGQLQPVRLARIGQQDAGASGVGHDAHARASRHRLRREQRGDVEELFERVGADHSRLLEERVDRDVEARERRRMARRRARPGCGSSRLDRDDRLAGARPPARGARTCAGCRSSRDRARSPRFAGRPPSRRAGRCSRRRPCCRPRRTSRGRGRASRRSRAWRCRARRSARASRCCRPAARWERRWR